MTRRYSRLVLIVAVTSTPGVCLAVGGGTATRPAAHACCPMMPAEKVDSAIAAAHPGKTSGSPSEEGMATLQANPDEYDLRLASSAESPQQTDEGVAPAEHGHHQTTAASAHGSSEADAHGHDHTDGCCGVESKGFFADQMAMFAKFHPPAVNFPIAMIIGAALAEALLFLTGRSVFAGAGRFCIWVGAIGAGVAALLGWFWGGFDLVDASWVMTAHRWLGTSTVAWSAFMLFLSERSARREHAGRGAYRAALFLGALLVAATGFFGGSLRYGLMHYLT